MSEDNVERVPHQEPKTTEVSQRQQQGADRETGRHTGRHWAVTLLIILGCILLAAANGAFWLRGTVLSTNRWAAAVGPLSRNEAIANTVSVYVGGDLFEAVDVTLMVEEALPEEVKVLSGPLVGVLQDLGEGAAATVIQSDQFNAVWVAANRAAHTVVMGALRGGGSHLYLKEGQLTIDVSNVLDFVEGSLDLPALGLSPDQDWGKFVLLQSAQVARVQQALGLLDTLGWLFPLATLVAFVAAWLVSLWRRRTLLWIGVGGAITMVLSLIVLALAEPLAVASIADPLLRTVAGQAWGIVLRGFVTQTVLLLLVGVLIAVGAWLAGPHRSAVAIRTAVGEEVGNLRKG